MLVDKETYKDTGFTFEHGAAANSFSIHPEKALFIGQLQCVPQPGMGLLSVTIPYMCFRICTFLHTIHVSISSSDCRKQSNTNCNKKANMYVQS